MKKCPECKNEIDPLEIYGDWFYCFVCNKNFDYPTRENSGKNQCTLSKPTD